MSENNYKSDAQPCNYETNSEELPPTGYRHVQPVAEHLEEIQNKGYSTYEVFSDWVDMQLYSLQANEKGYSEVIDKYSDEDINTFAQAFGELQFSMNQIQTEAIGDLYELLGMSSDDLGQHFTPHTVAKSMAQMQLSSLNTKKKDSVRIADPASGSGRFLIWSARIIQDTKNVEGVFFAQDKDSLCAKMSALNFVLFGLNGDVYHADTLTNEVFAGWRINSDDENAPRITEIPESGLPESHIE